MIQRITSPLIIRIAHLLCLALLLSVATLAPAKAAGVLDHLPADALGFVHIQDLGTTNSRVEEFTKLFELPFPAPLEFVKLSLGIADGVDTAGDALWATLPGTAESTTPRPLFILPVADYEKFAASIKGDPNGEIGVVTIADTDVLVARKGSYAAFMNVEHRDVLQQFISSEPRSIPEIAPISAWLAGNSASVVLMPAGVETLVKLGREGLAQQQQQLSAAFADPALAASKEQLEQGLNFYRLILDTLGDNVHVVACGTTIDENTNIRFALRTLPKKDGELTPTETSPTPVKPLAGYPDEPFVIAGGGSTGGAWIRLVTDYSLDLMQRMPGIYGLQDIGEAEWQKFKTDYQALINGLQMESMSMILTPGKPGDPIFSSFFGVVRVKDSAAYLDTFRQAMKLWNDLMAKSTGKVSWQYEIQDKTVGDAKGIEMSVDIATMMGGNPNAQMMAPMMQMMFGSNGVIRQVYLPADDHTLVYGIASDDAMKTLIDQVRQAETGLQDSSLVQTTDRLLPATASWRIYISPQGAVEWGARVISTFMAMMGQAQTIPEFPASPPVGITINVNAGRGEVDVVWPVDSLKALADFIKKCQAM